MLAPFDDPSLSKDAYSDSTSSTPSKRNEVTTRLSRTSPRQPVRKRASPLPPRTRPWGFRSPKPKNSDTANSVSMSRIPLKQERLSG